MGELRFATFAAVAALVILGARAEIPEGFDGRDEWVETLRSMQIGESFDIEYERSVGSGQGYSHSFFLDVV